MATAMLKNGVSIDYRTLTLEEWAKWEDSCTVGAGTAKLTMLRMTVKAPEGMTLDNWLVSFTPTQRSEAFELIYQAHNPSGPDQGN